jgi:hypothetical protein
VDAWAFERLAASARTLRDAGALDAAARAVAAARRLYGGELFDGEDDHPAVVDARDRLARLRDELDDSVQGAALPRMTSAHPRDA